MKQYLLISALLFGFTTFSLAQKKEGDKSSIPAAAKAALTKAFPGATAVKWDKEKAGYEAEFKLNGKQMSANFDGQGSMLESETAIKSSELPAPALEYIKTHYKGAKITETAKIVKANGEVNYEAEIKKMDVMFDANGKFLKEVKD
ncbi:MAG: PepSY-like domain-containing protein [Chitinophagaceae bacterium]